MQAVQIVLWYLDLGCSKHITGQQDKLINFVSKFMGTTKFGNDHFAAIMSYGDLQIRNILILRVYYVEGLGHNLFSVEEFCDSDLEVAFRKHTCFVRNLEGLDLLSGSCGLLPNLTSLTPTKPPLKKELDNLFQPMFDEYFKPTPSAVSSSISAATLSQDIASATSSTKNDQDSPSPKYGMESSDDVDPPIVERFKLGEDPQGSPVDPMRQKYGWLPKSTLLR
ncbi:hypothetical protein Tco_1061867 [Tanacetum coccineum]